MTGWEETVWGRSLDIFEDVPESAKKRVYCGGVNELNPHAIIPLHTHTKDYEQYILLAGRIKILVLKEAECYALTEKEVMERLKASEDIERGEIVECPKGYAHIAYNPSADEKNSFVFLKYKEEE